MLGSGRRWLPWLLLAVLLVGARGEAAEVVGLVRVDPQVVEGVVESLGDDAPPERIAAVVRRLYALGYFDRIVVERDAAGHLRWRFVERPFVREVVVRGIEALSEEKRKAAVGVRAGQFLDPRALSETRRRLEEAYREEGYPDVRVAIRTEPVAGAPGEIRVVIEVEETEEVRIAEVYLRGNRALDDGELLTRIQSRPASPLGFLSGAGKYDPAAARTDRYRLEAAYLQRGYLQVRVDGPKVSRVGPAAVVLEYTIQEGRQWRLGRIEFRGDLLFGTAHLRSYFPTLAADEPLDRLALEEGIRALVEALSDFGFAFARVEPRFRFDEATGLVDVELAITKGPLVYVRRIEIVGNTKTRDKVIRRELLIGEGELYSGRAIRLSRERVYALGYFEAVTFETEPVAEDLVDLRIQVAERPTGTASAGLGYSSIDGLVGNLRLNFGNLAGYGIRLDLQAEFGGRRQTFSVSYTDPYLLDTRVSLGIDLFRNRQEYFASGFALGQTYAQENRGGRLTLGYKLGIYDRVFLAFHDEATELSDTLLRSVRFFTGGETRSLTLTWRRDARDHPFDPTAGHLFLASVEAAGGVLGADHVFTKYRLLGQAFYTLAHFLTFATRAEVGLATTPGERVPFAERYFVGGILTLRGYDYRAVGPSLYVPVDPSDPFSRTLRVYVGGNKQVLATLEAIFPLLPQAGLKGVLFLDTGNTWLEEQPFFATALRVGYGFGLRWFSPIGPLRFEWGFPWQRRPDERPRVFEFTIGSYF